MNAHDKLTSTASILIGIAGSMLGAGLGFLGLQFLWFVVSKADLGTHVAVGALCLFTAVLGVCLVIVSLKCLSKGLLLACDEVATMIERWRAKVSN